MDISAAAKEGSIHLTVLYRSKGICITAEEPRFGDHNVQRETFLKVAQGNPSAKPSSRGNGQDPAHWACPARASKHRRPPARLLLSLLW